MTMSLLTLNVFNNLPIADRMRSHYLLGAGAAGYNGGAFPGK